MLQIEIIPNTTKTIGAIQAVVDFANPNEIETIIRSILEQHLTTMHSIHKNEEALRFTQLVKKPEPKTENISINTLKIE